MSGDLAVSPGDSGPDHAGARTVVIKAGNPTAPLPYVIDTPVQVGQAFLPDMPAESGRNA